MISRADDIPNAVRQKAAAQGAQGQQWLERLDSLLRELEQDWNVTVGPTLSGGSESLVAAARPNAGEHAVIKVEMPPYASFANEVRALAAANGHGYVRLINYDEERHAMLQERLGSSLRDMRLPIQVQLEIVCVTLRHAWEAPAPAGLPTGAEKAQWLADFIVATWDELGQPCSRRLIEHCIDFAERRKAAFDPETAVMVHGDAHSANVHQDPTDMAGEQIFRLVDPDGLLAEPACDLAVPMREWSSELLAGDPAQLGRERCARLSRLTGVDSQAIWEWGFLERVSTGLLLLQVGAEQPGRDMLEVAEAWARP